jgi:hypothetical protein
MPSESYKLKIPVLIVYAEAEKMNDCNFAIDVELSFFTHNTELVTFAA